MEFNVIAEVGTTEVTLTPYPAGVATVPAGMYRKFYTIVLANKATVVNTVTFRIYRGTTLEASWDVVLAQSSTLFIVSEGKPVLVVPPGRTLRAVASASSVSVLMTGEEE